MNCQGMAPLACTQPVAPPQKLFQPEHAYEIFSVRWKKRKQHTLNWMLDEMEMWTDPTPGRPLSIACPH